MPSAQSAALRAVPGYAPRPSTKTYKPPTFTPLSMPAAPSDGRDYANAPGATDRAALIGQLPFLEQLADARYKGIKADAQQRLAGYGGFKFRQDDPATPEREDLILDFDAGMGLGEREKMAVRGEVASSNSRGMLYSSFANQNIGNAVQRLSLEAQQIANQYAQNIQGAQTDYAGQVANISGQVANLYGQDAAFLIKNPPPTPDPTAALPKAADGSPMIGRYKSYPHLDTLRARYPGYPLGVRQTADGSFVVVIGQGAAKPPAKKGKK